MPMKKERESGIGGERRIFLPKREGYKYKHISYDNAKKAAQNKRMYAKYENVRWKGHGACNNVWRKGYVCCCCCTVSCKQERARQTRHSFLD
jgi:hypothetical protein